MEVDDVVAGKSDGTRICGQCKKNPNKHDDRTVANLFDELINVARLLAYDPKTEVFFSQSI